MAGFGDSNFRTRAPRNTDLITNTQNEYEYLEILDAPKLEILRFFSAQRLFSCIYLTFS